MTALFSVEGMNSEEASAHIEEHIGELREDFASGGMKSGRFLGLYAIIKAAMRGDITAQVALGNLYEFGSIVDQNAGEAEKWYREALAHDHPKKDGTMLAAGAAEGMKRLQALSPSAYSVTACSTS